MNLFKDRIETLLTTYKSTSDFARKIGVSEGVVRKWKEGKSEPSRDKLAAIAHETGASISWLVLGEDSQIDKEFAMIPGYNVQVSAGSGLVTNDSKPTRYLAFRSKWLKFRGFKEKDLAIVFTKGDSMEPTISDNDSVMVDTSDTQPKDGNIYVIRSDDTLLVKRIQVAPGQGVWLISDNKEYKDLLVKFDESTDLEVIGRVVWIGKDV